MATINATYFANYDDHDGGDEVPCQVDTTTMEVVSFSEATSCRWYDGTAAMCTEETIELDDGRSFPAVKWDEYNDAIADGYADDYDRSSLILFDADDLASAMSSFEQAALASAMDGLLFTTCAPRGIPGLEMSSSAAADDVRDAAEHMRRAARSMGGNISRNRRNNERWKGFYDDYLAQAEPLMDRIAELRSELEELAEELRHLG